MYWPPLKAKEKVTLSLFNLENDHQWSVNDIWPSMMGDPSTGWPLISIFGVLTSFIGKNHQDHWAAALKMNQVVIVWEAIVGPPLAYQHIQAAKTLFIDVWDHIPPRLPKIQDQKLLSLCWRSLSRRGGESVALSVAQKGGQYNDYR